MAELRFDGQAAVVTGAGRGVGRSHALLLASRGASVVVADSGGELDGTGSSNEPATRVVEEIEAAGGRAVACCASVADEKGAASIVGAAIESFGRLDIVINNAGISDKHVFADLSIEQFHRMLAVHFLGTVHTTKLAWPHFVDAGYGRIVNTTSEAILGAQGELASYGSAKGAVWAFTRNLAVEGAALGILANAVAPRARTRLSEEGKDSSEVDGSMLARMDPDLVAPVAAYLAHKSCALNGEVLVAGGGDVFRITPLVTLGISNDHLSIEDVAENIDAIMRTDDGRVPPIGAFVR